MNTIKQTITHTFLTLALLLGWQTAHAATSYAVSVSSSAPGTLGAPDGSFHQFSDFQVATYDMGSLTTGNVILDIYTFDDISPASAKVEISADNISFSLVGSTVFDTNGTVMPGPVYPSASFVIAAPFRYVRITDNADGTARNLGFDLDAIGVTAVPVPAAAWLFISGLLGLAGFARAAKGN